MTPPVTPQSLDLTPQLGRPLLPPGIPRRVDDEHGEDSLRDQVARVARIVRSQQ